MDDIFEHLSQHVVVSPADKLRYTRWENLQRYKQHKELLQLLTRLRSDSSLCKAIGTTTTNVNTYFNSYTHDHLQASKTFTVCPTCYKALRGRAPRKVSKSTYTDYNCNICNKPNYVYSPRGVSGAQNRKIHHTSTLAEANNYVRSTYPELFI